VSTTPLRPELVRETTLGDPLPRDPLPLVRAWFDEAIARRVQPNPLAMTLATVDADGSPSARMVLCRGYDFERGFFVFYTDRRSRKARALDALARAALVFHWDALERQIRVEGPVVSSPEAESDAYFAGRPLDAQLAARTSEQSAPIDSRAELVRRIEANAAREEIRAGAPTRSLPRPAYWGGYRVFAERIELWVGQPGRVHDRGLWSRSLRAAGPDFEPGAWRVQRLQP
jgi:pyridoxamine 5'-phosphate oxidase